MRLIQKECALVICGRSLTVKLQPSKLATWVRFPSPAPFLRLLLGNGRVVEGEGRAEAAERGFLLHWGGAKTKGLFFVLARRCRPLADMSPARVGFNAPSSKNSRLIFAQQPRPNGKRNPLHHVLRTAGTGRAFEGGALLTSLVEQRPVGEEGRVQGSGFRMGDTGGQGFFLEPETWIRGEQPGELFGGGTPPVR